MNTATALHPPVHLHDVNGPPAWPLVGHALQVHRDRLHQGVERWAHTYGPVFKLRFGRLPILVVTDPDLIASLLRERPHAFRRPSNLEQVAREMGLKSGLFLVEGEHWHAQRRMVMSAFSPNQIRAYLPLLLKVTRRLVQRWQPAAATGAEIDLQADLMRFTVDAIAGLAFGVDTNTLQSDEDVIQRHLDRIFPALYRRVNSLVPYWRWVRMPSDRALERSMAEVHAAIDGFIARARQALAQEPAAREQPRNLIEAFIVAADQPGSDVDDEDVAGNMFTMLLAGEDTTANTLSWLLYLLDRHPECLRRVREEVRRVAPDPDAITMDQLSALDYLDACLHEAMRLKPVAPFNVVETLHETTVAGVILPPGTLIWCGSRYAATDEARIAQAAQFNPQRWLGEPASELKRASIPFGSGPRVCPGRYLALTEMKLATAALLGHFELAGVRTRDGREAQEKMSFTMTPVGLRMRLTPRAA
jgi:cytochrome P450